MSNCIHLIKNQRVVFTEDEIDIEKFWETYEKVEHLENAPKPLEQNIFWWFLQKNSVVIFPESAADGKGFVEIFFGYGRSTHTWRDFFITLDVLAEYILRPKKHEFILTDESDGFRQPSRAEIDFAVGRPAWARAPRAVK